VRCAASAATGSAVRGAATLPAGLRALGCSPTFTAETVPEALLQRHATAPDCWAELVVGSGQLLYTDLDSGDQQLLQAGDRLVIPPARPHRVAVDGPVGFRLEFYRGGT
jgi:hemoglobin